MRLLLIRHGRTRGNAEHRYVGCTDEGILPEERERLRKMVGTLSCPSMLFMSPMCRCRETAECLFPEMFPAASDEGDRRKHSTFSPSSAAGENEAAGRGTAASKIVLVPEFREMDFGDFEYRTWQEIDQDPDPPHRAAYQRYIDSGGETAFPNGESKAEFISRVVRGFEERVRPWLSEEQERERAADASSETETAVILAHGGTIMALMERYAELRRPYFDWSLPPGGLYQTEPFLPSDSIWRLRLRNS